MLFFFFFFFFFKKTHPVIELIAYLESPCLRPHCRRMCGQVSSSSHQNIDTFRIHVITIFQSPTIAGLSAYLKEQYAGAVRRIDGTTTFTETETADIPTGAPLQTPRHATSVSTAPLVDAAKIARLRRLIAAAHLRCTPAEVQDAAAHLAALVEGFNTVSLLDPESYPRERQERIVLASLDALAR